MVNWKLFLVISVFIGIGGILTVSLLYTQTGGDVPFDYGVVIDAGSSHTRLTAYKWEGDKERGTGLAWQVSTCEVIDGLAKNTDPEAAARSLRPCLQNITGDIPSEKLSSTPLMLGATAGMRLLNISAPDRATATMIALRCMLEKSGFSVKKVEIISGTEESLSAWVTVNFLQGLIQSLEPAQKTTIGALDMGGASTQFAFEVPEPSKNGSAVELRLYGTNHSIFSHSYLCFGADEAYRRHMASLVKDLNDTKTITSPCLHKGYQVNHTAEFLFDQPCTKTFNTSLWLFQHPEMKKKNFTFEGSSESDKCSEDVSLLLNPDDCRKNNYTECFESPGAKPLNGSFMAVASYFHTTNFTNTTKTTLENFENTTSWLCQQDWDRVKVIPSSNPKVRPKFCFQSHLIKSILVDGYGFTDATWQQIQFVHQVNGTDVGWSLGYMVNATNAIPTEMPNPPVISLTVFILLLVLSCAFLLMSLVFLRKSRENEGVLYDTI